MSQAFSAEYTALLRSLMQQVGISSFRALSQTAGVSDWQIEQLRRGQAAQIRAEALFRLSQALQVPLADLLTKFSHLPSSLSSTPASPSSLQEPSPLSPDWDTEISNLKQEYQRLQTQLEQQHEQLHREFQATTLDILKTWLIQFPSLIHAAQHNPDFPARSFIPFIRPIEQLLKSWGIEAIAPVGAELSYDPQLHQLDKGIAREGDRVKVRFTGYRQGDRLLYRALVIPVVAEEE